MIMKFDYFLNRNVTEPKNYYKSECLRAVDQIFQNSSSNTPYSCPIVEYDSSIFKSTATSEVIHEI